MAVLTINLEVVGPFYLYMQLQLSSFQGSPIQKINHHCPAKSYEAVYNA